jgi:subtilisin family serine protease
MKNHEAHPASDSPERDPGPVDVAAVAEGRHPSAAADIVADRGKPRYGTTTPRVRSSWQSRIVEVQFRPGATRLAVALASDAKRFIEGTAADAADPAMAAVQTVLLRYNLEASRPSFAPRFIQDDEKRLANTTVADNAASPDPLADLPPLQSFVRLQFPSPEAAADAARDLRRLPDVEKAIVMPRAVPPNMAPLPTDPFIGTPQQGVEPDPDTGHQPQWYLHRTFVPEAWRLGARGAGVVIADIDWGFLTSHPDLEPHVEVEKAHNAVNRDKVTDRGPEIGHGTAVLGLAGAAADGAGMSGYAPEASLWPIQGDNGTGTAPESAWHDAIVHVTDEDSGGRRKVIILEAQTESFGNPEQMPSVHLAIRRAIARDVVVCVAAGNGDRAAGFDDKGEPIAPATGSILVGATVWDPDPDVNRRWELSNWGPEIVVSAPGDLAHDVTCWEDGRYTDGFGGTSGAAAKVAGVAALLLSVNPTLSHENIREILSTTGTRIELEAPEKLVGVFLNAAAAVGEALRRPGARVPDAPPPAAEVKSAPSSATLAEVF